MGMDSCSARLDRYPYYDLFEKQEQVRRISADYKVARAHENCFDAQAIFRLDITDKSGKKFPLSVECTFRAHFHVKENRVNEDFARRFTETEFRIVVWPYFRQFIADTTARMIVNPIVIPFSSSED
jgi:preprotein translocase subunit SecB